MYYGVGVNSALECDGVGVNSAIPVRLQFATNGVVLMNYFLIWTGTLPNGYSGYLNAWLAVPHPTHGNLSTNLHVENKLEDGRPCGGVVNSVTRTRTALLPVYACVPACVRYHWVGGFIGL